MRRRLLQAVGVLFAVVVLVIGAAAAMYPDQAASLTAFPGLASSYDAKEACSCRYVAGRSLEDCKKDFEPGMQAVFLSDDPEARSVTAYVPLLASETARYRDGPGCLLDPWRG